MGTTTFVLDDEKLGASIERATKSVEDAGLEGHLKRRVVELWHETEKTFRVERAAKRRD